MGHKALQYSSWLNVVNVLINQKIRTVERDIKIEKFIHILSNLK